MVIIVGGSSLGSSRSNSGGSSTKKYSVVLGPGGLQSTQITSASDIFQQAVATASSRRSSGGGGGGSGGSTPSTQSQGTFVKTEPAPAEAPKSEFVPAPKSITAEQLKNQKPLELSSGESRKLLDLRLETQKQLAKGETLEERRNIIQEFKESKTNILLEGARRQARDTLAPVYVGGQSFVPEDFGMDTSKPTIGPTTGDITQEQITPGTDFGILGLIPGYAKASGFIKTKIIEPYLFEPLEKKKGLEKGTIQLKAGELLAGAFIDTSGDYGVSKTAPIFIQKYSEFITPKLEKGQEFLSGVIGEGIIGGIREDPLKLPTYYLGGKIIGFGLEAAGTGIASIPVVGGTLGTTFKATEVVGGTILGGKFAYDIGTQIYTAPTAYEKGAIFGESAVEITALGAGFSSGRKDFQQALGLWRTRGRTEIPIERLVPEDVLSGEKPFPTAPKSQQLRLFESTSERFPELTGAGVWERPGATLKQLAGEDVSLFKGAVKGTPGSFHTTASQFWDDTLLPSAGRSELPGMYGGSDVSIYFSRISGTGEGYNLLPNIKELISPYGKPGIAFLQPKEFRVVKGWEKIPGVPSKPLGFKWTQPAKPGFADIPLMKTEIEAVFRPEAGGYGFVSGKYYTTFKDIKIPIDVFKYQQNLIATDSGVSKSISLIGGQTSYSGLSPSSYAPKFQQFGILSSLKEGKESYQIIKSDLISFAPSSKISISYSNPSTINSRKVSDIIKPLSEMPKSAVSRVSSVKDIKSSDIISDIDYTPKSARYDYDFKFPLPKLGYKEKITGIKVKQPFKRIASIVSAEFGIKAPKPRKGEITGLIARPLISKKKKEKMLIEPLAF